MISKKKEEKMLDFIEKELEENIDLKYKEFNQKLCPDTKKELLGIRIPVLRKLAKKIIATNPEEFLKNVSNQYLEEVLLEGYVIAGLKVDIKRKLELFQSYIPKIDSWMITDTVCSTIKPKKNELNIIWDFIGDYLNSPEEFEKRFAVIMMLDFFLIDEYVDQVIIALDKIQTDQYYVQMAIAWCLAEIGIKYPEKGMNYLKGENHLDDFTFRKTLQKMRESYRISKEQKEVLKKMKRS